MTNHERQIFAKNFLARRTSRIVSAQNGFNDVMSTMQFDADAGDAFVHDSLEDTVDSSSGAPTDTTRTDGAGDSDWQGNVPGGSNDDSPIYGAIDILQKHIESLGDDNLLDKWASTADALKKTVTSGMAKASVNADGQTREPLVISANSRTFLTKAKIAQAFGTARR